MQCRLPLALPPAPLVQQWAGVLVPRQAPPSVLEDSTEYRAAAAQPLHRVQPCPFRLRMPPSWSMMGQAKLAKAGSAAARPSARCAAAICSGSSHQVRSAPGGREQPAPGLLVKLVALGGSEVLGSMLSSADARTQTRVSEEYGRMMQQGCMLQYGCIRRSTRSQEQCAILPQ